MEERTLQVFETEVLSKALGPKKGGVKGEVKDIAVHNEKLRDLHRLFYITRAVS
jgi:hypothetical protein